MRGEETSLDEYREEADWWCAENSFVDVLGAILRLLMRRLRSCFLRRVCEEWFGVESSRVERLHGLD